MDYNGYVTAPVLFLIIAFTGLVTYGIYWGVRHNRRVLLTVFNSLIAVIKPHDTAFTSIGGCVGCHARLYPREQSPVTQIDATLTLLPRHSWLYMPISFLIMRYDRLFITVHVTARFPGEGHLIETGYARFRGPEITNAWKMTRDTVRWGHHIFYLYYDSYKVRDRLYGLLRQNHDPGAVRHIALVPDQRKGFIFMIPGEGHVGRSFAPVYDWMSALAAEAGNGLSTPHLSRHVGIPLILSPVFTRAGSRCM